jgi:hypothetical protein
MINIDRSKLNVEYEKIKSYLAYYEEYGAPLVEEYSHELDEKVDGITNYLNQCRTYNLEFDVVSLQRIVIDLSSTIYYTSSRLEQVEILADMAKISYKDKYNEAYTSKQGASRQEDRKYTSDQLKALADQEAIEEELVHFIYEHCAAILKTKIDSANELLKAVSKSLSGQIASMQQFGIGSKYSGG